MKERIFSEQESENKNELSLEKAKELLNLKDDSISDERLMKIIDSVKIFCKVAYELYSEEQNQKTTTDLIELHPIEQLKEAA